MWNRLSTPGILAKFQLAFSWEGQILDFLAQLHANSLLPGKFQT